MHERVKCAGNHWPIQAWDFFTEPDPAPPLEIDCNLDVFTDMGSLLDADSL